MNSQRHNKAAGAMAAVVWNILLLFVAYGMTRLAFLLENHATYGHLTDAGAAWSITLGGLRFDASAIAYTNALYLLLVLLPCHVKENNAYHRFCKYLYLGINALALAVNLADAVYYQFTARRTTVAFLNEFGEDDKLEVKSGRFGPYLAYDGTNYRLPKAMHAKAAELTYEECMDIINKSKK